MRLNDEIDNAPTVEPEEVYMNGKDYNLYLEGYKQGKKDFERPKGKWIEVVNKISENETETHWECSECHNPDFRLGEAEFCSFCGADMRGDNND